MKQNIRLEGIYDGQTLKFMRDKGIDQAGFDFRPRSFNFLQQYRFEDILRKLYTPSLSHYLRFENEKDFVVKKIVGDLAKLLADKGRDISQENIFLEFSDDQDPDYYDQFGLPYFWHYDPLKTFGGGRYLAGLVLGFSLLEEHHQRGDFDNFTANFFRHLHATNHGDEMSLILSLDWDSDIFPGLYEYFDFDMISLPINNKVEFAWRRVNQDRIAQNLRLFC